MSDSKDEQDPPRLVEGQDYTITEEGLLIFSAAYLKKRGFCCHQGCRNCPYGEGGAEDPSGRT